MAATLPRFAVSHTVAGSAIFAHSNAVGTTFLATIPAGRYWTDTLYTALAPAAGSPDLLQEIAFLIDANLAGAAVTASYVVASDITGIYQGRFSAPESIRFRNEIAGVTTAGRLAMLRIGVDPVRAYPTAGAATVDTMLVKGVWQPSRGEAGDLDEHEDGYGSLVRSFDGTAYTLDVGTPQPRRLVELPALPVKETRRRNVFPDIDELGAGSALRDYSFETLMWPWLARGELVRYYADQSVGTTFLTVAMTATSTQAVFSSTPVGFVANTPICIDGEWVYLDSLSAGTTWNLWRTSKMPVAHPIGSPASIAFVATYALDESGGNVNRGSFAPNRRGPADDRHDLEIALVRAAP